MVLDKSWYRTTVYFGHKGVTVFHFIALCTGIANFVLNGIIWIAFSSTPRLLSKGHLYLFYAFAITNCLTGFSTIPTYVNLYIHNNLNCPRWTILLGSSFEIALDRIRAVITLAISMERLVAIYYPGYYYFLNHHRISVRICLFACAWGALDACFMIFEEDINAVRVHCVTTSSSGPIFHWYFLLTNIFCGLSLMFLYAVLFCRLVVLRRTFLTLNKPTNKQNQKQANSLTIAVIMMVLIFSVMPCCLYLYDMVVGEVVFMQWGPIVTIGYHCYGVLSFFFYNYKHQDIRLSLRGLFCKMKGAIWPNDPGVCWKNAKSTFTMRSTPSVVVDGKICAKFSSSQEEVFL